MSFTRKTSQYTMLMLPLLTVVFVVLTTCDAVPEDFWSNGGVVYDPVVHPKWPLLSDTQCGISDSFRIIGGKNAGLGTYPWVVRLAFKWKPGTFEYSIFGEKVTMKCSGTIINKKYILTAGHCFSRNQYIKFARIGDYDSRTNPDCDEDTCAPPYVDYEVESVTIHPKYSDPVQYSNDISLVRVKGTIKFNEYVRPICLPHGNLMLDTYLGMRAEVAGWGFYNLNIQQPHPILQVVTLPIVPNSICEKNLNTNGNMKVTELQICAGGVVNRDSCNGDSGGPLMIPDSLGFGKPRYFLIGIVSFGLTDCGVNPVPAVYTRVASYMDWVLKTIKR